MCSPSIVYNIRLMSCFTSYISNYLIYLYPHLRSGKCAFPYNIDEDSDAHDFKDFEVSELKIDDALKNLDPTDLGRVDETLLGLADIDPSVVMAVSIAAARAGSRHKGTTLYKFLAEVAATEPQLPVPVPSILCRTVGEHRERQTQHVQLYPVKSASLENALTTLMKTASVINEEIVASKLALTVSSSDCSQLATATTEEMCTVSAWYGPATDMCMRCAVLFSSKLMLDRLCEMPSRAAAMR